MCIRDSNRTDFVYEPGQFSVRGGILDVFSYASDLPYRIELNDDVVESIRRFETLTQLSQQSIARFSIIPNMHSDYETEAKMSLFELLPMNTVIWMKDLHACTESLNKCFEAANRQGDKMKHYDEDRFIQLIHRKEYINGDEFISGIENLSLIHISEPTRPY